MQATVRCCCIPHSNIETHVYLTLLLQPAIKKQRTDHRLLTSSLMLIDRTASDGNGKMSLSRSFVSLAMVMEEPEILDGDRTEVCKAISVIPEKKRRRFGKFCYIESNYQNQCHSQEFQANS